MTFALSGGGAIRLTDVPGHAAGPQTVLGWNVADIVEAVSGLKARGITFTRLRRFRPGRGRDLDDAGRQREGRLVHRSRRQCAEPDEFP